MKLFMIILLGILLICAVAVSFSKNLLNSVLIYMSFSLVMSLIWLLLESSDLAITEAAVGAGVTTVLFIVTLKKLHTVSQKALDETVPDGAAGETAKEAAAPGMQEAVPEETAAREAVRQDEKEVREDEERE